MHCVEYRRYAAVWADLCRGYKGRIAALAPRSAAELQGMADGAGLDA
jgi:hypothetical protein